MSPSDKPDPLHIQLRRVPGMPAHPTLDVPDSQWLPIDACASNKKQWLAMSRADKLTTINSGIQAGHFLVRFPPFQALSINEPGGWNLEGDQAFASRHPLSWNYLRAESPNYWFKLTQKQVYLRRIEHWLAQLPSHANVLEIGGGIGRFSTEWLRRGFQVTHTDPNNDALTLALEHLSQTAQAFSVWQLGAEDLALLSDDAYAMVSAFEVFCYLNNPRDGLQESMRVLQPNGLLILSVETTAGASARGASDSDKSKDTFSSEHDVWVHLYTRERLEEQLKGVGFDILSIQRVHYLLDGPHADQVDFDQLDDANVRDAIAEKDQTMDNGKHGLPRAWLAIAQKPALSDG